MTYEFNICEDQLYCVWMSLSEWQDDRNVPVSYPLFRPLSILTRKEEEEREREKNWTQIMSSYGLTRLWDLYDR